MQVINYSTKCSVIYDTFFLGFSVTADHSHLICEDDIVLHNVDYSLDVVRIPDPNSDHFTTTTLNCVKVDTTSRHGDLGKSHRC